MDKYEKGETLGQGQFGHVFRATVKATGQEVAIKKVKIANLKEGIHVTALREIKILRELHSPHVVELVDVFITSGSNLALVLEYMESDLEAVIKDSSIVLSRADIKSYMQMALQGLAACHAHNVIHRDIKPNNFLTAATGHLKLADFGLSKVYGSPAGCRTAQVFARWYRSPELLWGSTNYGPAVDIWATGCVFAELALRRPWLVADTDIKQLSAIFAALGTPSESGWKGMQDLPSFLPFTPCAGQPLEQTFAKLGDDGISLLRRMVELDPSKRITAAEALKHPFFTRGPAPTPPEQLARPKRRADDPLALPPGQAAAPAGRKGASSVVAEKRARGLDTTDASAQAAARDQGGNNGTGSVEVAAAAGGKGASSGTDGKHSPANGVDGKATTTRGSLSSDPGGREPARKQAKAQS